MHASSGTLTTEEPRCPKCGYSLLGLSELRCPECGAPFDREYIEDVGARRHLLQWERPELGRRTGRLGRTIAHASLHPGRFFSALSQRKDRPIQNAGSFVVACSLVSICSLIAAALLEKFVFFLWLTRKHGAPLQALDTIARATRITASTQWFMPSSLILTMLLSVLVIAILLARFFRSRSGALRTMDLAAAFSPAIAFGAFIGACAQVALAIPHGSFVGPVITVTVWGQVAVLLLLVWHFCRKLLALSRAKTVAMVIICGILQYECGELVSLVLRKLLLATLL